MTAILKVDTIQDTSGNNIINENANTITIGKSGDTTNIVGTLQNDGAAISIASLSTASGSAPSYSARAWVNFNGTGTVAIRASGNISSITDNGVGNYDVNFGTNMADTNYAVVNNAASSYSTSQEQWVLQGAYEANAVNKFNLTTRLVDNDAPSFVAHDVANAMIGVFR